MCIQTRDGQKYLINDFKNINYSDVLGKIHPCLTTLKKNISSSANI